MCIACFISAADDHGSMLIFRFLKVGLEWTKYRYFDHEIRQSGLFAKIISIIKVVAFGYLNICITTIKSEVFDGKKLLCSIPCYCLLSGDKKKLKNISEILMKPIAFFWKRYILRMNLFYIYYSFQVSTHRSSLCRKLLLFLFLPIPFQVSGIMFLLLIISSYYLPFYCVMYFTSYEILVHDIDPVFSS